MLAKKAREVLKALDEAGLLKDIVLIGSWCGHFYRTYFGTQNFVPTIQTLDIDFLIPKPRQVTSTATIESLLTPLDFDEEFTASGWLRFVHPDLRVEFLIPRYSPQSDEPRHIAQLDINAMPLRHTAALVEHLIIVKEGQMDVRLPHPAAFALHKLFVSGRRKEKDKAVRDRETAFRIMETLQVIKQTSTIDKIWPTFTKKERQEILQTLEKYRPELIALVKSKE